MILNETLAMLLNLKKQLKSSSESSNRNRSRRKVQAARINQLAIPVKEQATHLRSKLESIEVALQILRTKNDDFVDSEILNDHRLLAQVR